MMKQRVSAMPQHEKAKQHQANAAERLIAESLFALLTRITRANSVESVRLRQRDALERADDVVRTFLGEEAFVIAGAEVPVRAFVIFVAIKSPHTAHHDEAAHSVVPVIADVVETQVGTGVGTFKADVVVKHQLG